MLSYKSSIDIIGFCICNYHMKHGNSTEFSQVIWGGFFEVVQFKRSHNNLENVLILNIIKNEVLI